MRVFEAHNATDLWKSVCTTILEKGEEVKPRGMLTKEISPVTMVLHEVDDAKNVLNIGSRKLGMKFMAAEMLWILSGSRSPWILKFNKRLGNYMNEDRSTGVVTWNGAYGPRLLNYRGGINQLGEVVKKLIEDPDSRQCSATIFDPLTDYLPQNKDVVCNQFLRFKIRNGALDMINFVRSQDCVWGMPYDIFNFTTMLKLLANILGVRYGKYIHIIDSCHIYEDFFEKVRNWIADSEKTDIPEIFKRGPKYNSFQYYLQAIKHTDYFMESETEPSGLDYFPRVMRHLLRQL